MSRISRTVPVALLIGLLQASACGDSRETPVPSDQAPAAPVAPEGAGAGTRIALPGLFTIMAGLEQDMYRISRGLWLGAPDTIAAGADGIATHPTVPPEEAEAIAVVLGAAMQEFAGLDGKVHDLSVQIREMAREGEVEAILPLEAELRRGCVGCHERFRDTLRVSLR